MLCQAPQNLSDNKKRFISCPFHNSFSSGTVSEPSNSRPFGQYPCSPHSEPPLHRLHAAGQPVKKTREGDPGTFQGQAWKRQAPALLTYHRRKAVPAPD